VVFSHADAQLEGDVLLGRKWLNRLLMIMQVEKHGPTSGNFPQALVRVPEPSNDESWSRLGA
jgi:hypothetical protein